MKTFPEIFSRVEDVKLRTQLINFHNDHEELMKQMPASLRHHHKWIGGYYDHVLEVCNNCLNILDKMELPLSGFSVDELILAAYFHDIDKLLVRYMVDETPPSDSQLKYARSLHIDVIDIESKSSLSSKIDAVVSKGSFQDKDVSYFVMNDKVLDFIDSTMVISLMSKNGFVASEQVVHAITYHHGMLTTGMERNTSFAPIAVVLHSADFLSAVCQGSV
jgi:hypothetical protein